MRNCIGIVGRIADKVELLDGQTVKTKVLYEELKREFPSREIICVDTYQYRKHVLSILLQTWRMFWHCEHIFVLLSRNGRKFFFPILNGLNKVFKRKIYHDVIGGALQDEAAQSAVLRKQLTCFHINWVESVTMKENLEKMGITNVEILTNFKRLSILEVRDLKHIFEEPYVFVIFSRIVREKGINEAAQAIENANRRFGKHRAVLHIYGPIDPVYDQEFSELLKKHHDTISYKGCVPYNESVQILKNSFMLLFPSIYPGEGIPGTIIDAFSAGLPVIATNWHFNGELVRNDETGYCYNWKHPEQLTDLICYVIEHPECVDKMRPQCLKEARKYTPEIAMKQILKKMNE